MSLKDEAAFPRKAMSESRGLSIRQYYVAKAMKGIVESNLYTDEDGRWNVHYDYDETAAEAFRYADALIKFEEEETNKEG